MKEKIRKECYRRVRAISKIELNSAEVCSFKVMKWTLQDLRRIDANIKKLLTSYMIHHPKADKNRSYLPRSGGGRSLIQIALIYKTTIGLHKYLQTTKDGMVVLIRKQKNSKKNFTQIPKKFERI